MDEQKKREAADRKAAMILARRRQVLAGFETLCQMYDEDVNISGSMIDKENGHKAGTANRDMHWLIKSGWVRFPASARFRPPKKKWRPRLVTDSIKLADIAPTPDEIERAPRRTWGAK